MISVVMVTYNHEKYISEAVLSVINQTFDAFELIVIDDGSTDNTGAIMDTIRDPRMRIITQENQGPNVAVNVGISQARGKYIALMSGDDVCDPQRLERQAAFTASSGAKVICSWIGLIDDDSKPFYGRVDLVRWCNRDVRQSRAEILRTLSFDGNYLWSASALIETDTLRSVGGCCLSSLQLSDFMLWIALIKRTQIFTLHEPLLRYRIRGNDANLSQNPANLSRVNFEMLQVYRMFLDETPENLFREAFFDDLRDPRFVGGAAFALEKAFIYFKHPHPAIRQIGMEKLFVLLQDEALVRLARDYYDFHLPDYYRMTNGEL